MYWTTGSYMSSLQASFCGFFSRYSLMSFERISLTESSEYGTCPAVNISQQVTPKAHCTDIDNQQVSGLTQAHNFNLTTSDFSEKIQSLTLSGGSHFSGNFMGESRSCLKYSLFPMLSESPKSATFITKFASILHKIVHQSPSLVHSC